MMNITESKSSEMNIKWITKIVRLKKSAEIDIFLYFNLKSALPTRSVRDFWMKKYFHMDGTYIVAFTHTYWGNPYWKGDVLRCSVLWTVCQGQRFFICTVDLVFIFIGGIFGSWSMGKNFCTVTSSSWAFISPEKSRQI